jgi:cellulose synthase (UDP-forming)
MGSFSTIRVSRQSGVWLLRLFILGGVLALLIYLSWLADVRRWYSPLPLLVLITAVVYASIQLLGNWYLYLRARCPISPTHPTPDLTVDVFVTTYDEPIEMVERNLKAACAVKGPHRTWLLDDSANPALEHLAAQLGAGYLARDNRRHAKAGNINAALAQTTGEIVVIFDTDHVPTEEFLERTLSHFCNPKMGFVQVMLTFNNGEESWVARAAMETSLEYYNPTSLGNEAVGGTTLMGSNALLRRAALESIGGYQPGLAEDLATSIHLHAAGWQSAYVAEPLAPGIAPPSFTAWFLQQMKWARGVFELLITTYPRLFQRLTWGQRLTYITRMTRYWIGPVIGLHLFATIFILIFGSRGMRDAFHEYLIFLVPVALFDAAIRTIALRTWRHEKTPTSSLLGAITLVYATWPIYLMAWLMAVLRLPLAFRPTPKSISGMLSPIWLLPQVGAIILLTSGVIYTVIVGEHRPSLLLFFAIMQGVLQLILLIRWWHAEFIYVAKRMDGTPLSGLSWVYQKMKGRQGGAAPCSDQ